MSKTHISYKTAKSEDRCGEPRHNMDDTENLNHKYYTYKLWLSGWMWEGAYQLDPYDNYDDKREARQDFLELYNEYYKESGR